MLENKYSDETLELAKEYLLGIAIEASMQFPTRPKELLMMGLTPQEKFLSYAYAAFSYPPGSDISAITATTPGLLVFPDQGANFQEIVNNMLIYTPLPIACDQATGDLLKDLADMQWNDQGSYVVVQWQKHVTELVIVDR